MSVNDSVGRGDFIGLQTASTTEAINPGLIVEVDSNGDVVLPTTTPGKPIGVAATKVDSRTTASKEDIVVQVSGLAHIKCAANEGFSVNDLVGVGAGGVATTYGSVAGSTFGSENLRSIVGRCIIPDATTEGTTVVVLLGL